jgi:hypothetical protein
MQAHPTDRIPAAPAPAPAPAAAETFSNRWKMRDIFFQSLEKPACFFQPLEKSFPIIGKFGGFFPTIGNFFSNHWKHSGGVEPA